MLDGDGPRISIAIGITIGLIASFVQSLGLTIQRKSHLLNESLPPTEQRADYKRPLWIGGFAIFISSNLLGTIFQIGALPIVVLGPLGAVSLLYNAFFAKIILGDRFTLHLIAGTILIAGGAVLIGIFGVVPGENDTHTLEELVAFYVRAPFLIWMGFLSTFLIALLLYAHITEWKFERRVARLNALREEANEDLGLTGMITPKRGSILWTKKRRSSVSIGSGKAVGSDGAESPTETNENTAIGTTITSPRKYGALDTSASVPSPLRRDNSDEPPQFSSSPLLGERTAKLDSMPFTPTPEELERTKLILGIAYGSISGTLSGLCLLFAKTGVELLILTVVGRNQFGKVEAWLIVLVLLFAALLQLFYLNRALRLLGPTLICPLAFCFYNLSSIISGLIYYDQWTQLSNLQFGLVGLGTAVLLAGVWIVSFQGTGECGTVSAEESERLLCEEMLDEERESDDEGEGSQWIPRGLTIGIGAASPGFAIRPTEHHRRRSISISTISQLAAEDFLPTAPLPRRSRSASEAIEHNPPLRGAGHSKPVIGISVDLERGTGRPDSPNRPGRTVRSRGASIVVGTAFD